MLCIININIKYKGVFKLWLVNTSPNKHSYKLTLLELILPTLLLVSRDKHLFYKEENIRSMFESEDRVGWCVMYWEKE